MNEPEAGADPGGDLAGKAGRWIERLAAVAGEIEACLPPEPGATGLEEDEG